MSTKNKTSDGVNKGKGGDSLWKKAFTSNTDWPDKVRICHEILA